VASGNRGRDPGGGLGPRIFAISSALLAFEIILLRLFAVQTFHHFAYMAIGVALLGFGASGTVLVLGRSRVEGRELVLFQALSVVLPAVLVAAPALGQLMEFEPTQFLWDWRPWIALTFLYGCLAVPFFVGASAITLALMMAGGGLGRLYAWNMVGSGMGGVLALGLLYPLPPDRALAATVLPALWPAATAIFELFHARAAKSTRAVATWVCVALLCTGAAVALVRPPWALRITPFKGLPQVEAFPQADRVGQAWDPTGWVTAVRAPAFHHAPGLSLAFTGALPEQVALFVDGETAGAATVWDGDTAGVDFLDWLPSSVPYVVDSPESVLVLGSGDGLQILNALAHGAESVTAVEFVRPLVGVADRVVVGPSRVYSDPRVETVVGDARAYAARTDARFDLIVLATTGSFAVGASGIHGTGESYLETVEAYRDFLSLLEPGGTLAITRWLRAPPRDNVKLIFTLDEALDRLGGRPTASAVAFLRSWATGTALVRPSGFRGDELERLRDFADTRLFDVDWPPSEDAREQYNTLDRPVFREAVQAAAGGETAAERFRRAYPFDVSPATDDRPYFGQFLRLTSLPTLLAEERGAWLPVAEWGYLAVVATLIQSAALSLLLLGLPVAVLARSPRDRTLRVVRIAAYFGTIGLGFMFVELAVIQRLGLVLGHPVLAAASTLAVLLVFSGVGSAYSDRVPMARTGAICALVALVALAMGLGANGAGALVSLPFPVRASACLLILAVPGFLMGGPFPMGLRMLAPEGAALAWAWAANGVASVIGASVATLLAMEVGGGGLLVAGAVCYVLAASVAAGAGVAMTGEPLVHRVPAGHLNPKSRAPRPGPAPSA
jgi:hypothetical protein